MDQLLCSESLLSLVERILCEVNFYDKFLIARTVHSFLFDLSGPVQENEIK